MSNEFILVFALPLTVLLALVVDWFCAEVRAWHPLVGFGYYANYCERLTRKIHHRYRMPAKLAGVLAWCFAIVPLVLLSIVLLNAIASFTVVGFYLVSGLVLYFTLGGKSLNEHALAVYKPLANGDLQKARGQVARMVSRETDQLSEQEVVSATVESVLENGNDAVFGALFWYVLLFPLGLAAPAAILFRLANTLDAMWGYKNERYINFGYCAAKLDDALGYFPARLTALTYALQGRFELALYCWRTQAKLCLSPNGGVVMTAGAGALNCKIGGSAIYHGQRKEKIVMGTGRFACYQTIPKTCRLVTRGSWLWLVLLWLYALVVGSWQWLN